MKTLRHLGRAFYLIVAGLVALATFGVLNASHLLDGEGRYPLRFHVQCRPGAAGHVDVTYGYNGVVFPTARAVYCPVWDKKIFDYDGRSQASLVAHQEGDGLLVCTITRFGDIVSTDLRRIPGQVSCGAAAIP